LTQRFIYVREITSKKETLQVIRRVLPFSQDIACSFCFTGAETDIHKIKDDSKIDREKIAKPKIQKPNWDSLTHSRTPYFLIADYL
jgi:hypothetical protein